MSRNNACWHESTNQFCVIRKRGLFLILRIWDFISRRFVSSELTFKAKVPFTNWAFEKGTTIVIAQSYCFATLQYKLIVNLCVQFLTSSVFSLNQCSRRGFIVFFNIVLLSSVYHCHTCSFFIPHTLTYTRIYYYDNCHHYYFLNYLGQLFRDL